MRLNYKEIGEGDPIIIVHGLFGSLDNWMTMAKMLSETFHVYLIDQRNHGRSPHSDHMNYRLMAKDLGQFIQDHEIYQPTIIGHSMGGKAAMQLAFTEPRIIRKLVVVDIGIKKYPMHHQKILAGLNDLNLGTLKSRSEAEKRMSVFIKDAGVRQFVLKGLFRKENGKYDLRYHLESLELNMEHILEEIGGDKSSTDVLFIRGSLSGYILDEDFKEIKDQFPNSKIKTIEDCGHWIHAEKPKELYSLLIDFI